jgi:hypothetical protein
MGNAIMTNGTFIFKAIGSKSVTSIALKSGTFRPVGGQIVEDAPTPYIVVLSDNQRSPVFAIGFRIPSPNP